MKITDLDFLNSSLDLDGKYIKTNEVISWIRLQNEEVSVKVSKINLKKINNWILDEKELKHETDKFFKIIGIKVNNNILDKKKWCQPIIDQPEIGYLGFICKKIDNVLHFLVQAKIEPGNINYVQLSPTLQATHSNYTKVHKGKDPLYIKYFRNADENNILIDQLQSEQGSRFLKKRNRNIIISVDHEIEVHKNFTWLTLGQIKSLIKHDNLVNMDTRSVISTISFNQLSSSQIEKVLKKNNNMFLKSALQKKSCLFSNNNIMSKITDIKSNKHNNIEKIDISSINDWKISEKKIHHTHHNYFNVIGVSVSIGNREVRKWCQPMIEPTQKGFCGFIVKKIKNNFHFLVQLKYECGNLDLIEFGPTVQQTIDENLEKNHLYNIISMSDNQIIFDSFQSEEGGRFFKEQNRNVLCLINEKLEFQIPKNFIWMTLNQLFFFIRHNNYVNIQARSLISAISFQN